MYDFEEVGIRATGFNGRSFRRDGTEILPDLRAALYGGGAASERDGAGARRLYIGEHEPFDEVNERLYRAGLTEACP